MSYIFEEVSGLYQIVLLKEFRKTEGVSFDVLSPEVLPDIHSIDRVIHLKSAVSPGKVGDVDRPWYMHPDQADNLMVLNGTRYVDIYTVEHGRVESFIVSPERIIKNGKVICDVAAMLVWPRRVFHRIVSGDSGSASINLAQHYEGFDIKTNFNIYDLNTDSGEYKVIREGHLDQK